MNQLTSQRVHYYSVKGECSDQQVVVASSSNAGWGILGLEICIKTPSLDLTQTLLFPTSVTYTQGHQNTLGHFPLTHMKTETCHLHHG